MRTDRYPEIDLDLLPANPAPPDMWQDRSACFGIDPNVFFPISEEEAGPALAFCNACGIRAECLAIDVSSPLFDSGAFLCTISRLVVLPLIPGP